MNKRFLNLSVVLSTLMIAQTCLADLTEPDIAKIRMMLIEDKPSVERLATEVVRAMLLEERTRTQTTPVGNIIVYAGTRGLEGYLPCEGQTLNKEPQAPTDADYRTLYAVIGDTFTPSSERSETTFRLPDLRGRVAVGSGQGTDLKQRNAGDFVGAESYTLSAAQLAPHDHGGTTGYDSPDHSHGYSVYHTQVFEGKWPGTAVLKEEARGTAQTSGANTKHQHSITTDKGNGLKSSPYDVMQPSLVVRYMIKVK